MDQIYSVSYLTISADSTPDTTAGFLHHRNSLTWESCLHPSLVAPYGQPTPGYYSGKLSKLFPNESSSPCLPIPQEPRYICCGILPATAAVNKSILNERGWILQERLLSRRILHWGSHEVSWECNELIASERLPSGYGYEAPHTLIWEQKNLSNRAHKEIRQTLHTRVLANGDHTFTIPSPQEMAIVWHNLVEQFTSRALTVPSDRLPAISGLSNALGRSQRYSQSDYIFGMWKQIFFFDLCWIVIQTPESTGTEEVKMPHPHVPSFSWASVNCPIRFLPEYLLNAAIEQSELVTPVTHSFLLDGMKATSMELRGLLFDISLLALNHPEHLYENSGALTRESINWDFSRRMEDKASAGNVVCLCLGIADYMDKFVVSNSRRLFGILLQLLPDLDNNRNIFRRIGFYDGPLPDVNIEDMRRRVVTVI